MNDKNPDRDEITPDKTAGRRKRVAPTIDGEAKEIAPAMSAPSDAVIDPLAQSHVAPENEAEVQAALHARATEPDEEAQPDASKPEASKSEFSKSALGGSPSFGKAAPSDEPVKSPEPANATKPLLIGAASGALAAACVVAIAWSAGTLGTNTSTTDPRIASLEAQFKELQNRPAPASGDQVSNESGKTDALTPRIAKVEDQVAKLASTPSNDITRSDLAKNESALASLGVALAALNKRYDELAATTRDVQARATAAEQAAADLRRTLQDVSKTAQEGASSSDVTSLQTRLAALEDQSKAARADLVKATESDKAARLALSATAVRDAALRGVPFAEELAQAKSLGASELALAPLWPFAASGVPAVKAVSKELSDLLPQMRKAVAPAPVAANGFFERLQANAETLVRVRPAGAPASDDGSVALARLEGDLSRDDIAAALTTVSTLPQAARQLASDWVTRAVARQKALAAARDFAADSSRSLGSR